LALSEDGLFCTFSPTSLWVSEGFFPTHEWKVNSDLLAEQLASDAVRSSLYSYRLAQAMQRLLGRFSAVPRTEYESKASD